MTRHAAADSGLEQGSVLAGKYRLNLALGEGGMATVWSAYHLELEIPVAIKLLRGRHDSHLAQRLKLEARAAARIAHPTIVRVLDVAATAAGVPFIVMDLLSGETLADLLARERLSAVRVVQLLLPIIDGLGAAHAQGVVHRDLKPANVFLHTLGGQLQPKILDFGIAKLGALKLTEEGTTLGSPSYMSPEQARGDDVDFRSDVWSMCVLLYKAIGGRVPFRGADTRAILDAILQQRPPPLPLGAGVDGHLSRIVLSGLSKAPAARPESMRQLGQQLARWLLLHGVAVDACGAPLVTTWLSSEPPQQDAESAGPVTRRLAPPPPLPPKINQTPARVPLVVAPNPRRNENRKQHKNRFMPGQRRWLLGVLAGVTLAGASLALTKSTLPKHAAAPEPLVVAPERPRPLVLTEAVLPSAPTIAAPADSRTVATTSRSPAPARRATDAHVGRPKLPF
jgi:serine/threonine-protein kinase